MTSFFLGGSPSQAPQRSVLVLLAAGIAASVGGWFYVDRFFRYEDPLPAELIARLERDPAFQTTEATPRRLWQPSLVNDKEKAEIEEARRDRVSHFWRSQVKQSALAIGIFGALLGGTLAFADSAFRRGVPETLTAIFGAAAIGSIFGAVGGVTARFSLNPLYFTTGYHPIVVTIMVHVVCWSILALGIGLSFRWGIGGWRESVRNSAACILGGITAGLVFTPLCSYLLPIHSTVPLVPEESMPRLLWMALAGCAIASFPAIVAIRPAPASPP